jgi:hypothetical protein
MRNYNRLHIAVRHRATDVPGQRETGEKTGGAWSIGWLTPDGAGHLPFSQTGKALLLTMPALARKLQ